LKPYTMFNIECILVYKSYTMYLYGTTDNVQYRGYFGIEGV